MNFENLNKKQLEILDFIRKELNRKGYPPSLREIGRAVNLKSTSTVHGHLERLEKKGFIRRDATKPRAIEILDGSSFTYFKKEMTELPIVGKVTAGQPILAQENIEDFFPVPLEFIGNNDSFILIVKGNSMIDAGIFDKDYVIVSQQSHADNGDIVVALLDDDEATIKKFYKENGHYRLQPENKLYEPLIVDNLTILGKVIAVFRKL